MTTETAWGPSKSWKWGDYGRYQLEYYSPERRSKNRHRWAFSIAGSGSIGSQPWVAMFRAWRFSKKMAAARDRRQR